MPRAGWQLRKYTTDGAKVKPGGPAMLLIASILAGLTVVASTWLYARRPRAAAVAGLAGQIPWAAVIVLSGAWGLAISWTAMTIVHIWNLVHLGRRGSVRILLTLEQAKAMQAVLRPFRRKHLDRPNMN